MDKEPVKITNALKLAFTDAVYALVVDQVEAHFNHPIGSRSESNKKTLEEAKRNLKETCGTARIDFAGMLDLADQAAGIAANLQIELQTREQDEALGFKSRGKGFTPNR